MASLKDPEKLTKVVLFTLQLLNATSTTGSGLSAAGSSKETTSAR